MAGNAFAKPVLVVALTLTLEGVWALSASPSVPGRRALLQPVRSGSGPVSSAGS
jgi:hypothetical protein